MKTFYQRYILLPDIDVLAEFMKKASSRSEKNYPSVGGVALLEKFNHISSEQRNS